MSSHTLPARLRGGRRRCRSSPRAAFPRATRRQRPASDNLATLAVRAATFRSGRTKDERIHRLIHGGRRARRAHSRADARCRDSPVDRSGEHFSTRFGVVLRKRASARCMPIEGGLADAHTLQAYQGALSAMTQLRRDPRPSSRHLGRRALSRAPRTRRLEGIVRGAAPPAWASTMRDSEAIIRNSPADSRRDRFRRAPGRHAGASPLGCYSAPTWSPPPARHRVSPDGSSCSASSSS